MHLLTPRRAARLLALAVVASAPVAGQVAAEGYGPSSPYTKVLHGQYRFVSLPDAAKITKTRHGYVYEAGQQDSNLVVTRVAAGIRFHDRGTEKWKGLAEACKRSKVSVGVAAVCAVPAGISARRHLLLEIWPRLGDDRVDASSLSAVYDVAVLADAGVDVVRTGAGDDFVNGAFDADRVSGGRGSDWIRTGGGSDTIRGGRSQDKLVGSDQRDIIRGGRGGDQVRGGNGSDRLVGNAGTDLVSCASGRDSAVVDRDDRTVGCESVLRTP